jgi:hypothetical protein
MAKINPSVKKQAKQASTAKEKNPNVSRSQASRYGYSDSAFVKAQTVKEKDKPARLNVVKPFSEKNKEEFVSSYPKKGQPKKTIKTYEGGKLVMTEKQGRNILGQPKVKIKTTGEGGFKKGKEKITLTKKGEKVKTTYGR